MTAYEFVKREQVTSPIYPVVRLCHALGVSPGGYWAWRSVARRLHQASRGLYGVPCIHATLRAEGIQWAQAQRIQRRRLLWRAQSDSSHGAAHRLRNYYPLMRLAHFKRAGTLFRRRSWTIHAGWSNRPIALSLS